VDGAGVTVRVEFAASDEAVRLMRASEDDMRERYPQSSIHGFDWRALAGPRGLFVLARAGGQAVGCGGVQPLAEHVGEIKRVFVVPQYRRRGVARLIMATLEAHARERGFEWLRLETGTRQPESIALYRSLGYVDIVAFGEYAGDPFSVCFEKRIVAVRGGASPAP
jgi:putative acetyltransferase